MYAVILTGESRIGLNTYPLTNIMETGVKTIFTSLHVV